MTVTADAAGVVSPMFMSGSALLEHWQGHRRLTRRVIDAFPEDRLLGYSVASMRPFGALAMELIRIAEPMVRGIVTADWTRLEHPPASSKDEILARRDDISVLTPEIVFQLRPQVDRQSEISARSVAEPLTSAACG